MNKFLVVFSVLCVASATCVQLENLCPSSHFEYQGILVNSFIRVNQSVTFQPLNYYLAKNVRCDAEKFKNRTNYLELLKIRDDHNDLLTDIYSEKFLNGAPRGQFQFNYNKVVGLWKTLFRIWESEETQGCIRTLSQVIDKSRVLLTNLNHLYWDRIGMTGEMFKQAEKALKHLKIDEDNQMLAFRGGYTGELAFSEVFAKGKFEFLKRSLLPFRPGQKGRLHYDMILPFYTKKPAKGPCVSSSNLPLFYKNKGN